MERGIKVLVRILLVATLLGLAVILLKPEFRETAKAMFRGDIESSPIWQSNAHYYPDVNYKQDAYDVSK